MKASLRCAKTRKLAEGGASAPGRRMPRSSRVARKAASSGISTRNVSTRLGAVVEQIGDVHLLVLTTLDDRGDEREEHQEGYVRTDPDCPGSKADLIACEKRVDDRT